MIQMPFIISRASHDLLQLKRAVPIFPAYQHYNNITIKHNKAFTEVKNATCFGPIYAPSSGNTNIQSNYKLCFNDVFVFLHGRITSLSY
jgi:hypothetical protein